MSLVQNDVNTKWLNRSAQLPFVLRLKDFEIAMQDVYDFFYDVNLGLIERGLQRLDDMLQPAIMSGILSDMLTTSLAKHSRSLTVNLYHNGYSNLVVIGIYPDNKVKAGSDGVEIKATRNGGGAVDTHGARDQWIHVFVYGVDNLSEPAKDRAPMTVTEIYLGNVTKDDFRKNPRGELGARTATLHKSGIEKLRKGWVYKLNR